jgi:hypothetical protein
MLQSGNPDLLPREFQKTAIPKGYTKETLDPIVEPVFREIKKEVISPIEVANAIEKVSEGLSELSAEERNYVLSELERVFTNRSGVIDRFTLAKAPEGEVLTSRQLSAQGVQVRHLMNLSLAAEEIVAARCQGQEDAQVQTFCNEMKAFITDLKYSIIVLDRFAGGPREQAVFDKVKASVKETTEFLTGVSEALMEEVKTFQDMGKVLAHWGIVAVHNPLTASIIAGRYVATTVRALVDVLADPKTTLPRVLNAIDAYAKNHYRTFLEGTAEEKGKATGELAILAVGTIFSGRDAVA